MKTVSPNASPSIKAARFFKDAEEIVVNLAARWLDESEFENIEDYGLPLIPVAAESGVEITKMCKKPFGCEFTTDGRVYRLSVHYNGGSYEYRRVR